MGFKDNIQSVRTFNRAGDPNEWTDFKYILDTIISYLANTISRQYISEHLYVHFSQDFLLCHIKNQFLFSIPYRKSHAQFMYIRNLMLSHPPFLYFYSYMLVFWSEIKSKNIIILKFYWWCLSIKKSSLSTIESTNTKLIMIILYSKKLTNNIFKLLNC